MTDKLRDLIEDVRTVYKGKGMLVYPNSFDRLRTEIIKLDNINNQQSEQIKKLEKGNAELKSIADFQTSRSMDGYFQLKRSKEQLAKAKEVIKGLLCILYDKAEEELNSGDKDIIYKAEEFLKKE